MEATVIRIVRVALSVIVGRLMALCCLAMTFVLSMLVMQDPDWIRAAMAAFFALFVFIPCILKEGRNERSQRHQEPERTRVDGEVG
jgi:hypothetical protein